MRPKTQHLPRTFYAVRVRDTTMSPAFEPGYMLQVDPSREAKPGDTVVIHTADGRALLKRLVQRSPRAIVCAQFNPRGAEEFAAADVRSIDPVISCAMVDGKRR